MTGEPRRPRAGDAAPSRPTGPAEPGDVLSGDPEPLRSRASHAYHAMRAAFRAEGLPVPPVPPRLLERLELIGPMCYSTRPDDGRSPYAIERYEAELRSGMPRDYAIVGHAGYGASSHFMHCYVVEQGVAALVQKWWGGIIVEPRVAATRVREAFTAVGALLVAGVQARGRGGLARGQRVVAIESDLVGHRLLVGGRVGDAGWQDHHAPIEAARRWLDMRTTEARQVMLRRGGGHPTSAEIDGGAQPPAPDRSARDRPTPASTAGDDQAPKDKR